MTDEEIRDKKRADHLARIAKETYQAIIDRAFAASKGVHRIDPPKDP